MVHASIQELASGGYHLRKEYQQKEIYEEGVYQRGGATPLILKASDFISLWPKSDITQ